MRWFKHDAGTHNDEKIRNLIHEWGVEGYGVYMICLELIAEKIDQNLRPEIVISRRALSEKLCMKSFRVERVLNSGSVGVLLAVTSTEHEFRMSCPNLLKRLDNWTERSVVATEQLTTNKNKKKNKKKIKDIGVEKTDEIDSSIPPLKDEVDYHFHLRGWPAAQADAFWNFYESKGWVVGKTRMKKWKNAAAGWMSRNGVSVVKPVENAPRTAESYLKPVWMGAL